MKNKRTESIKRQFTDLTENKMFNMSIGCLLSLQKYKIVNSNTLFRIELGDSGIQLFQIKYENIFKITSVFDRKSGLSNLKIQCKKNKQDFIIFLTEIEDDSKNI